MGDIVSGIPDIIFNNPETTDAENHLCPVSERDVEEMKEICQNDFLELDEDFLSVIVDVKAKFHLPEAPDDFSTARNMYIVLAEVLENLLEV